LEANRAKAVAKNRELLACCMGDGIDKRFGINGLASSLAMRRVKLKGKQNDFVVK
jgi:hypothetical protein